MDKGQVRGEARDTGQDEGQCHRNSGEEAATRQGSTNSLESDSVRMGSHKAMAIRTEHWTGAPQPGRRTQSGARAGEGGKKVHAGKGSHRGPEGSPSGPHRPLCQWGFPHMPTDHREGTTYKTVHIWPYGVAFPRKTWPRSPGLQPPFKNGRECDLGQPC